MVGGAAADNTKMADEENIENIIGTDKVSHVDSIRGFDRDGDNQIRMYRRMGESEAESVLEYGLHARPGHLRGEIWLSTSLKHSRQFENKKVRDNKDDVVMAFKVDIDKFCTEFKDDDIIDQEGSGGVNKGLALADLKCLVHDEKLKSHPWQKLNFCLKGDENAKKFNKCVKSKCKLRIRERRGEIVIYDPENEDLTEESSESMDRKK